MKISTWKKIGDIVAGMNLEEPKPTKENEMAIIAKNKKSDFTPAPEGLWQAVCVDVVDKGMQKTPWGENHKVDIRWVISETMVNTGQPFMVNKRYTLSLHEKSNLRRDLEMWRGKKFTGDESDAFDLERLLGANCQIQVIHNSSDDGTVYANVQAIVPAGRGSTKIPIPSDYIRAKDREKLPADATHQQTKEVVITDDDIPF